MTDCVPLYEPGQNPTCHTQAAVEGCRFVKVATGVNAVDGNTQVNHATGGVKPFGVAARTKAVSQKVMVYRQGVVPVLAGEALAHGQKVEAGAAGVAMVLAAGTAAGTVMADAANGALAFIALELGA